MKTIDEDTRCIWMASHVVDYKLCDKNFDCEHCDFDKVMHNCTHTAGMGIPTEESADDTDIIDRILNGLMNENHHKRSIYLPNNLVLDELPDRTYRLSLSSLAGHFLDHFFSVVPCRQGETIRKGQPCVTLSGAWGVITVNSPIHFLFQDKSDDGIEHGSSRGVIGIIQTEKNEVERERMSPQEWQQQIIGLSRKLIQLKMQRSDLGQTLHDGPIRIKFLYQRIGKENYLDVLNFLFKQRIKPRTV